MHPVDIGIIIAYVILMALVGWWVSKKASQSAESYFLAGKSLPWWIIGVAHGSSGVDITGTMWFVMMLYVYGLKAVWLLWVWPLFNVIFRMMYLGTWVRRSNVLTGAEWMRTRFGYSTGAELAYLSVVSRKLHDSDRLRDELPPLLELARAINEQNYLGIGLANQAWLAWHERALG